MHAAGNAMVLHRPEASIAYIHSERFVSDMVKALQHNAIIEFKRTYRSVDALLIDDVQFFGRKERSQEELFHTFNALLEVGHQVIITADRFPKELEGIEERLISRFSSGLVVYIEPPELETRVAILVQKAQQEGVTLPEDVAFFVAKRVRSNVRCGPMCVNSRGHYCAFWQARGSQDVRSTSNSRPTASGICLRSRSAW